MPAAQAQPGVPASSSIAELPAGALVVCHDCDLVSVRRPLAHGEKANCARCGSLLYRRPRDVVQFTLACSFASLVLFVLANAFPFLEFKIAGRVQVGHMVSGVRTLHDEGYGELAAMVLFTGELAPLVIIGCLLLLTLPLALGRRPAWLAPVCKLVARLKAWSMMEVYLLGVIVSAIKLSDMAELVFGPASYAFGALIIVSTAALARFDPEVVWLAVEERA